MNSTLTDIITTIKATHTVPATLSTLLNIRPPRIGSAIHTPDFIRTGDSHPSFGIYNSLAIDFATGHSYDVIALVQKALNMSFIDAVEYLHGSPVWPNARHIRDSFTVALSASQQQLNSRVDYWHAELLKNSEMLDYLHGRHITDDTIKRFKLGYSDKMNRIMFPFQKNGRWCYFAGRDMLEKGTRPQNQPKYLKGKIHEDDKHDLAEHECYENVPWGLQTIHQIKQKRQDYIGIDGETYYIDADDPRTDTLCITEGLFDALSLGQDGWQVLATCGGHIGRDFMPSFLDIARSFRQVALFFDNDPAGQGFNDAMSRILYKNHIPFICGHIPSEVNAQPVKDVSDYYCAGGDLAELVNSATPGLVEMARQTQTLDELARLFRDAAQWNPSYKMFELKEACYSLLDSKSGFQKYTGKMINHLYTMATMAIPEMDVARMVDDRHTLLFDTAGVFYEYTKGVWSQVSDFEIQRYVADALGMKASSGRMRSVTSYLKAEHASANLFNRKNVIVLKNGTLHLDDVVENKAAAFKPHSEEDMCTQLVPCDYDPDASCDKWLKYVHDVCSGNGAKMKLMQQMAGYVMCPDNRYQKFFYLLGDGSNGKSIYMNVLEAVYGSDNCSSVQPSRLGGQFDPIALKDSLANFCYEAKSILNGSEEALKAVVSGDPIMAAHKGVDAVKFSTRAKIFIAANKCFASDDVSLGFLRRIIFFKFDKQFLGSAANKNLYTELLKELPGIFNWCLEGYIDLVKSGGFQELEEQAQVIDDLLTQMSPTGLFIKEVFPALSGLYDERGMYGVYKAWCDEGGFKKLNRIEFMKDLMLLVRQHKHTIDLKVIKNDEGRRLFVFPSREEDEDMGTERAARRNGAKERGVIALGAGPSDEGSASGDSGQEQSTAEAPSAESNISTDEEQTHSEGIQAGDNGANHGNGTDGTPSGDDSVHNTAEGRPLVQTGHPVHPKRTQEAEALLAREQSRTTTHNDNPAELSGMYKAGLLKPQDMTLGDWHLLYTYYRVKPKQMPRHIDFLAECSEYVDRLNASFGINRKE